MRERVSCLQIYSVMLKEGSSLVAASASLSQGQRWKWQGFLWVQRTHSHPGFLVPREKETLLQHGCFSPNRVAEAGEPNPKCLFLVVPVKAASGGYRGGSSEVNHSLQLHCCQLTQAWWMVLTYLLQLFLMWWSTGEHDLCQAKMSPSRRGIRKICWSIVRPVAWIVTVRL